MRIARCARDFAGLTPHGAGSGHRLVWRPHAHKMHHWFVPGLLLSFFTAITYGSAAWAKNTANERFRQFGELQRLIAHCDEQLAKKMAASAQEFCDYREQHGSFPEEGEETQQLEKKLITHAGGN